MTGSYEVPQPNNYLLHRYRGDTDFWREPLTTYISVYTCLATLSIPFGKLRIHKSPLQVADLEPNQGLQTLPL